MICTSIFHVRYFFFIFSFRAYHYNSWYVYTLYMCKMYTIMLHVHIQHTYSVYPLYVVSVTYMYIVQLILTCDMYKYIVCIDFLFNSCTYCTLQY